MIKKVLLALLALSIAGNIVQIIIGGIKITNNYDRRAYQNQSQSQLVVMLERKKGFKDWEFQKCQRQDIPEILASLPSWQTLFAKVICNTKNETCYVAAPTLNKTPKDWKLKKEKKVK